MIFIWESCLVCVKNHYENKIFIIERLNGFLIIFVYLYYWLFNLNSDVTDGLLYFLWKISQYVQFTSSVSISRTRALKFTDSIYMTFPNKVTLLVVITTTFTWEISKQNLFQLFTHLIVQSFTIIDLYCHGIRGDVIHLDAEHWIRRWWVHVIECDTRHCAVVSVQIRWSHKQWRRCS